MASDPNLPYLMAGYFITAFLLCGYLFSLLYRHNKAVKELRRLSAGGSGEEPLADGGEAAQKDV